MRRISPHVSAGTVKTLAVSVILLWHPGEINQKSVARGVLHFPYDRMIIYECMAAVNRESYILEKYLQNGYRIWGGW